MQELGKYFLFKSYRAVVIALVATTALRVCAPSACTSQGTPRSPGAPRLPAEAPQPLGAPGNPSGLRAPSSHGVKALMWSMACPTRGWMENMDFL